MKENSHIHFAHEVLEQLTDENIKSLISKHVDAYILGSVFPDALFYTKDTAALADTVHGISGNDTSELPLLLLKKAKEHNSLYTLVFTLGYLTHRTLDIASHPVIFYLTGSYYQEDEALQTRARYAHRQLECAWDKEYVKNNLIQKNINLTKLNNLYLPQSATFNITENTLLKAYTKFVQKNKILNNNFIYKILSFLIKLKIYTKEEDLGIFYASANSIHTNMHAQIHYRDLKDGTKQITSIDTILKNAHIDTVNMLTAAHDYYNNTLTQDNLHTVLTSKSLATGKPNFPVSDILYTMQINNE